MNVYIQNNLINEIKQKTITGYLNIYLNCNRNYNDFEHPHDAHIASRTS